MLNTYRLNMKQSIIRDKSFAFALEIIETAKGLQKENEYVLSKQLLRSGTSVGANVREALNASSYKDFIYKLTISQKECDESLYWIELLFRSGYIESPVYSNLKSNAEEQLRILRSIILTSKKKLAANN